MNDQQYGALMATLWFLIAAVSVTGLVSVIWVGKILLTLLGIQRELQEEFRCGASRVSKLAEARDEGDMFTR